uniref:Uncharacterized protein n=1 Tax=Meloidogyne javanica TaxID=6303 RepID=A0A915LSF0_MELJA
MTPIKARLDAGDNSRRQDRVPGQGGFAAGAARGAEDREQRRHDPALQSQVHEASSPDQRRPARGRPSIRRGLQPRHRRLEHEGANAVGHGQEGAGHQTSLRALRTRIGRKRKMRDDHEVPL